MRIPIRGLRVVVLGIVIALAVMGAFVWLTAPTATDTIVHDPRLPQPEPSSPATGSSPGPGHVFVKTDPVDAEVYLDGRFVGKCSSFGILVTADSVHKPHTLKLHLKGYADYERVFPLPPGKMQTFDVPLVRL